MDVSADSSVVSLPVNHGSSDVMRIVKVIKSGAEKDRQTLKNECKVILECKVCSSLFRGLTNFLTHKRNHCLRCWDKDGPLVQNDCEVLETAATQPATNHSEKQPRVVYADVKIHQDEEKLLRKEVKVQLVRIDVNDAMLSKKGTPLSVQKIQTRSSKTTKSAAADNTDVAGEQEDISSLRKRQTKDVEGHDPVASDAHLSTTVTAGSRAVKSPSPNRVDAESNKGKPALVQKKQKENSEGNRNIISLRTLPMPADTQITKSDADKVNAASGRGGEVPSQKKWKKDVEANHKYSSFRSLTSGRVTEMVKSPAAKTVHVTPKNNQLIQDKQMKDADGCDNEVPSSSHLSSTETADRQTISAITACKVCLEGDKELLAPSQIKQEKDDVTFNNDISSVAHVSNLETTTPLTNNIPLEVNDAQMGLLQDNQKKIADADSASLKHLMKAKFNSKDYSGTIGKVAREPYRTVFSRYHYCDVKNLACHKCHVAYRSFKSLKRHMLGKHLKHSSTVPCWKCGRLLQKSYNLKRHMICVHKMSRHDFERIYAKDKNWLQPLFSTPLELAKPFVVRQVRESKNALDTRKMGNLLTVKLTPKSIIAEQENSLSANGSYNALSSVPQEKACAKRSWVLYKCSFCSKLFRKKETYNHHVHSCSFKSLIKNDQECEVIGTTENGSDGTSDSPNQSEALISKLKKITNKWQRKCLHCGKTFNSNSSLKMHAVRYLGWKRFMCNLCGYKGFVRSEIKRHLGRRHRSEITGLQDISNYIISMPINDMSFKIFKS